MKSSRFINSIFFMSVILMNFGLNANDKVSSPEWIDLISMDNDRVERVRSFLINKCDSIKVSRSLDPSDDQESAGYDQLTVYKKGEQLYSLEIDNFNDLVVSDHIPRIEILTDNPVSDIVSTEVYEPASVTIRQRTDEPSLIKCRANIRCRGNTTSTFPKRPYRIKMENKESFLGLQPAKNYVLLANYIDNTLMRNAVALKLAELLEIPYSNSCLPVDVYMNGVYMGSYNLTEKIGINKSSVAINELKGILWELDTHFDEDWKFRSPIYDLPVNVKDPDILEVATKLKKLPENLFETWKQDFIKIEQAIVNGNPWKVVDLNSVVDFFLVNHIAGNGDINHPNSVFMYKPTIDSKLFFGPVWDFDWAFNYKDEWANRPLLFDTKAGHFFRLLAENPEFKAAFKKRWEYFKSDVFPALLDFIDSYAEKIRVSALMDGEKFYGDFDPEPDERPNISSEKFSLNVESLKSWLKDKVSFIDADKDYRLYGVFHPLELPDNGRSGQDSD